MTTLARAALIAAALGVAALGCKDAETRTREAQEKIRAQLKDPMADALTQKLPAEVVREAQEHLTVLNEYQGEVNGVLDSVTVNAVQAFQAEHGLEANGMLTARTLEALREAAEQKG